MCQLRKSLVFVFSALAVVLVSPEVSRAQWHLDGVPLCTEVGNQTEAAIVSDGAGGAIVTWVDSRSDFDIYAQHVLSTGAVDPALPVNGRALCTAAFAQFGPRIVSDGAGGAIVAWQDVRNETNYDIYAQHLLASGAVDPAWPVDGRALCTGANHQVSVTIVSDGAGGAIVAWDDRRSGTSDIYAEHVLSTGAVDPAWPVDGRALCVAASCQQYAAIVSDGASGAIVAWRDNRNGSLDIYAQHVLATGAVDPAWPVDGRALCTAAYAVVDNCAVASEFSPTIVSDGAGGAIVTWQDKRSGTNFDIYAQHVLSTGAVDMAWPVDGRALCSAANDQHSPTIVSDGAGGAIATWWDIRSESGQGIYAQHVLSTGAVDPAWPVDGRALSISDAQNPSILSDGTGGAIVSWQVNHSGTALDINAQHVLATGAADPAWPTNGRALCSAANYQGQPQIASDGTGGAIVTWLDQRSGTDFDIYAQRLYSSGAVAGITFGGGPVPLRLSTPRPNPAHGGRTTISFDLPSAQKVWIDVFDMSGRLTCSLVRGANFLAGMHSIVWDGRNRAGRPLSGGLYVVRVRAGLESDERKVVVLP